MSYELFISRASPYSSKIRALLGYTGLSHRVRVQNAVTRYSVIRRLTGDTMVPVLRRGPWAINDSTRIARYAIERSSRPTLPAREGEALAWIIEDFADEWVTRWMTHSRWRHREDSRRVSEVIGRELTGVVPVGEEIVGRQAARLIRRDLEGWGVRAENDEPLRGSALRCLELLETLLSGDGDYLFGDYPTVADFGLYGPLVQYQSDPTGRQRLESYPEVLAYIRRIDGMADRPPSVVAREVARPETSALQPLFGEFLGTYWSVLVANYRAIEGGSGRREATAELVDGSRFQFRTSRYLVERLEALLELVDATYAGRDRLFGEEGLRMERALIERIAQLCESQAGRRLLRDYDHVGMH